MKNYFLILFIGLSTLYKVEAQGHGPIFGLQTPTLAKGGVNMNAAVMSIATGEETSYMLRYTFFYGITEDLQVTLTTPTMIEGLENAPRTRGNSIMPANGDIEASLWYRFFSNAFGVGKRFESTAILGLSGPWGISFGALFPVVQDLIPNTPREKYRVSVNISYWL